MLNGPPGIQRQHTPHISADFRPLTEWPSRRPALNAAELVSLQLVQAHMSPLQQHTQQSVRCLWQIRKATFKASLPRLLEFHRKAMPSLKIMIFLLRSSFWLATVPLSRLNTYLHQLPLKKLTQMQRLQQTVVATQQSSPISGICECDLIRKKDLFCTCDSVTELEMN